MKHKIAFFDVKPYDRIYFEKVNRDYDFDLTWYEPRLNPETVSLLEGFPVICIFVNDTITGSMVDELYARGVRLIALRCAGYNNIDFKRAYRKIHVVRVPEYSPHAVAEHAISLMLSLNRKIHRAYYRTRDMNFSLSGLMGFDMHGKTAGVIGAGKIGKTLMKALKGFGMKVLAYDLYPDESFEESGVCTYVELDDLFAQSDIISLNCPLTKETEYLINRETISKMKKGVMLINTGRGKLIHTTDLIEGLKSGVIGSAGLDVYEEENEYFFEDLSDRVLTDDVLARLLSFNNVIVTSHQGFFTHEAMNAIAAVTLHNIDDFFNKKYLDNEICYRCDDYPDKCRVKEGKPCF